MRGQFFPPALAYLCAYVHIALAADSTESLMGILREEFPPTECMVITIGLPKRDTFNSEEYVECHDGSDCLRQAYDTKLYCAIYLWYSGDIMSLKSIAYQPLITKSILINLLPKGDNTTRNQTNYYIHEIRIIDRSKVIIQCSNGRVHQENINERFKIKQLCIDPWKGMVWKFAYFVTDDYYTPPDPVEISILELISNKLKASIELKPGTLFGHFEGSIEHQVLTGEVDFAGTFQVVTYGIEQWFTYPFDIAHLYYYSRYPIVLNTNWKNILSIFDSTSWLIILITLGTFSMMLAIIYTCYSQILNAWELLETGPGHQPSGACDFLLLPFFATTEPLSINWFSTVLSSGYVMCGIWRLLCLLIPLYFSSNLRAQLIKPSYEKPIDTHEDMLARHQNIWIPHLINDLEKPWEILQYYLPLTRPDIAEYVIERNTTFFEELLDAYSMVLPKRVMEDVLENGASLMYYENIMHRDGWKNHHLAAQYGQLRRSKDKATKMLQHLTFLIRRESPWRQDFDYRIIQLRELGFIKKFQTKVWRQYVPKPSITQIINNENLAELRLMNFAFIFTFLLIGLFLSFITICVEVFSPRNGILASL